MRRLVEISKSGLTSILLHPARSLVTFCALLTILVPYLSGLGISQGIDREASFSIRTGGDLYLTGLQFGRYVPLPLGLIGQIENMDGVLDVVPRIVGKLRLGREGVEAVIVGIPVDRFPETVSCIEGRLPREGELNEFVIGTELARRLQLRVGSLVPPFYNNPKGEHISKIVGLFDSDLSIWQSQLMFSKFDTAEEIFNQEGLATDFVIYCQPGYEERLSSELPRKLSGFTPLTDQAISLKLTSRQALNVLAASTQFHWEGLFNLHFLLVFVIGILVILVTTGIGLPERRREIGILKSTGWQTDEIILRSLVENSLLSVAGASVSILIAFLWLKIFNGYWIAGIFIPGIPTSPSFTIPFRLTPVPTLLSYIIALTVTLTGSLWSSWRAAVVPPAESMR